MASALPRPASIIMCYPPSTPPASATYAFSRSNPSEFEVRPDPGYHAERGQKDAQRPTSRYGIRTITNSI